MRLRVKDVRLVVDYLYQDERRHFEESGKPREHIYRVIERLRKCTGNPGTQNPFGKQVICPQNQKG